MCVQAMSAERDNLAAEVQTLKQRLQEAQVPVQLPSQTVLSFLSPGMPLACNKAIFMHTVQITVLLAYFLWEDYVCKVRCK